MHLHEGVDTHQCTQPEGMLWLLFCYIPLDFLETGSLSEAGASPRDLPVSVPDRTWACSLPHWGP